MENQIYLAQTTRGRIVIAHKWAGHVFPDFLMNTDDRSVVKGYLMGVMHGRMRTDGTRYFNGFPKKMKEGLPEYNGGPSPLSKKNIEDIVSNLFKLEELDELGN